MSKSLGNFFTVREILKNYRAEEIRYFILASHYRSPLNYSQENLANGKSALTRLYTSLRGITPAGNDDALCNEYSAAFHKAMDDDFNSPEAIAVLFEITREINKNRDTHPDKANVLAGCLHRLGAILGLLQADPEAYLRASVAAGDGMAGGMSAEEVEDLIARRISARTAKDWAAADRIRDELDAAGIILEDGSAGTSWRRN